MSTKQIFASLLILAIVLSVGQGLTIKPKHDRRDRHMAQKILGNVQSHMCEMLHLNDQTVMDEKMLGEMMEFVFGDQQILGSIFSGEPLSKAAEGRLKDFFKNNQGFKAQILHIFDDESAPECMRNLNDDQRGKIVNIIIDNMDFTSMMDGSGDESDIDDETVDNIVKQIQSDPDLGDDVVTCYQENADSLENVV